MAIGSFIYYYQKKREKTNNFDHNPEQVMTVLTKLRRELYPIFKKLSLQYAKFSRTYSHRFGSNSKMLSQTFKINFTGTSSDFQKQKIEIYRKVYSQFQIASSEDFEREVEMQAQSNRRISEIWEEIESSAGKICEGWKVPLSIELADHVTKETTIGIYKHTVKTLLTQLNTFLSEYQQRHGGIDLRDQKFSLELQKAMNPELVKDMRLREKKYDYSDEFHEHMVYDASIKQTTSVDQNYLDLINRIDARKNELLKLHLSSNYSLQELKMEIRKIDEMGQEYAESDS